MSKKWYIVVAVGVALGLMTSHLASFPWAEELPASALPEAFPEVSSSVIESRSWRLAGSDLDTLHEQAKAVVGQIPEAVIVQEAKDQLIISLPTPELSTLRRSLDALGSVSAAEGEAIPSAPTTLLRLTFVQP